MGDTVLVSGDELLVEEAVIEERARAVGDLDPAWVLTEVEPGPGFLDALAATATLGLGDEQRVVVVRRAGALDQAAWDALLAYVADQPGHVSLVIEGQGWVHSARSRTLGERVKAVGGRVRREELPPPSKRADAVRQVAGRRGVHLDPAAARYLAEYLGDEFGNLRGVLDQLTSIHGEGARLGEDEVAQQFQGARHGFQWDITDALDRGDAAAALDYVHGAFDHMHPLQVHAALVTHYRRLLTVAGRGPSPPAAGAEVGIKEFPAPKVGQQAGRRRGVARGQRSLETLHPGLDLRADGLVALPPLLVLPVALHLRLDVGHRRSKVSLAVVTLS